MSVLGQKQIWHDTAYTVLAWIGLAYEQRDYEGETDTDKQRAGRKLCHFERTGCEALFHAKSNSHTRAADHDAAENEYDAPRAPELFTTMFELERSLSTAIISLLTSHRTLFRLDFPNNDQ